MSCTIRIRIQPQSFDIEEESSRLTEGRSDVGALVTFTGYCRDEGGTLAALTLEHYPGMAEAEISRIAEEAVARWPLSGLTAIHRHGRIVPGEPIVLVAAASSHRQAAFEAASFMMDYLKTRAPFWKKEERVGDQEGDWVQAKAVDDAAAGRWQKP
ncbi:molybdopterin synthase catalytic subunit [Rhodopseudomonas julia]|uniref:Molybdopterin synthase catalytic subunit n=1 Tax=Rhodopseudomonas julia TaxID=200617 RepID=A0ABU0CAE9_9BRAD|nr:molybdenum cofactor biosynthesis protein MoaE [Rhodopseudomonas julia]MDQ0327496.1 molybdopterin synthase catalytic subunit [Rhodopseudomonas julia]